MAAKGTQNKLEALTKDFFTYKKFIAEHGNILTIKLFLSPLELNPLAKVTANVFSDYGAVHSAIQVGPFLLDWTTDELMLPRPIRVKKVVSVIDLKSTLQVTGDNLKKVRRFHIRH